MKDTLLFRRWFRRDGRRDRSRRGDRCAPEAVHIGNQSLHVRSVQAQRGHTGGFHLCGRRFQNGCQLSRWILAGRMSQRRPRSAASGLSVASTAAMRIIDTFPVGGGRCAGRIFRRWFRRPGWRSCSGSGWSRWGRSGRRGRTGRGDRSSPKAVHIGNQCRHISSIHAQRGHTGGFHLCGGGFQNGGQLSRWILTRSMSQRRPRSAAPGLSVASTAAMRIINAFPLGSGRCAGRTFRRNVRCTGCRS
jgi:hypothetical protein